MTKTVVKVRVKNQRLRVIYFCMCHLYIYIYNLSNRPRICKSMPLLIFLVGSFAVLIGDHFRSGISCGPIWGAFAVLGSFANPYRPSFKSTWCFSLVISYAMFIGWINARRIKHLGAVLMSMGCMYNVQARHLVRFIQVPHSCQWDVTPVAHVCHPCDTCVSSTGHVVFRTLVTCTLYVTDRWSSHAQWFSFRSFTVKICISTKTYVCCRVSWTGSRSCAWILV